MALHDTIRCARCQQDVPFRDVRVLPDGKKFACSACSGIVRKEETLRQKQEEARHDYQCAACRYRFQRGAISPPKRCPQCSAEKLIVFDSGRINASSLLR